MTAIKSENKLPQSDGTLRKKRRVESPRCVGCHDLVLDKYLFSLGDTFWHKACVLCDVCKGSLEESCFMLKDKKLFCRSHYYKSSFATKCSGCHQPMQSHEVAMNVLNRVYHVTCFACACCKQLLKRGDEFILHGSNSLLVCRTDYENGSYLHCSSNDSIHCGDQIFNDDLSHDLNSSYQYQEGAQDKHMSNNVHQDMLYNYFHYNSKISSSKRPRTTLTFDQKRRLMIFFKIYQNPSYKQRECLAEEMKLPLKVVQVWFQNQRAKIRQIKKLSDDISNSYQTLNDDQSSVCLDSSIVHISSKSENGLDQTFPGESQSELEYNCDQERIQGLISQSTEERDSPLEGLSDVQTYTPQDDTWHSIPKQDSNQNKSRNFNYSKCGCDLSTKSLNYTSNLSESWLTSNNLIKYPS